MRSMQKRRQSDGMCVERQGCNDRNRTKAPKDIPSTVAWLNVDPPRAMGSDPADLSNHRGKGLSCRRADRPRSTSTVGISSPLPAHSSSMRSISSNCFSFLKNASHRNRPVTATRSGRSAMETMEIMIFVPK